jgi:hypothetical protein
MGVRKTCTASAFDQRYDPETGSIFDRVFLWRSIDFWKGKEREFCGGTFTSHTYTPYIHVTWAISFGRLLCARTDGPATWSARAIFSGSWVRLYMGNVSQLHRPCTYTDSGDLILMFVECWVPSLWLWLTCWSIWGYICYSTTKVSVNAHGNENNNPEIVKVTIVDSHSVDTSII